MFTQENSLGGGNDLGIPEISYCSPLMRCLATNTITFAPLLDVQEGKKPKIATWVYEVHPPNFYMESLYPKVMHRIAGKCVLRVKGSIAD